MLAHSTRIWTCHLILFPVLHPGRGFKFKMAKIILVALDMEFTSGCDDHLDEIHYIDSRANQYSVYRQFGKSCRTLKTGIPEFLPVSDYAQYICAAAQGE